MNPNKLEVYLDKLIFPALITLVAIIGIQIFFYDFKSQYREYFYVLEASVILVFIGDLSFKFKRAKNWKNFLKDEWLEIIAIIPFFWVFRALEGITRLGELLQEILHIIARGGRLIRLSAALSYTGERSDRFQEFLRKITGSRRFEKASEFFHNPKDR